MTPVEVMLDYQPRRLVVIETGVSVLPTENGVFAIIAVVLVDDSDGLHLSPGAGLGHTYIRVARDLAL